jgi:hypothetical protein
VNGPDCAIIIPSHKRAGRVTTMQFLDGGKLCVPEAQYDEYRKHHAADQIVTHPDSIIGIARKRTWIINNFAPVCMVDDDFIGLFRLYMGKAPDSKTPNRARRKTRTTGREAYDIIQNCYATAVMMNTYLFGFATHVNPASYRQLRPYSFGGYVLDGCIGIAAGSKLFCPDSSLPVSDFWLSLLNAALHRYCWLDQRFACGFKETYTGQGGLAEFRHPTAEEEAYQFLRAHFGEAIQRGSPKGNPLTKRVLNKGRRRIVLPYTV